MEEILTGMGQKDLDLCPGVSALVITVVMAGDGAGQQGVDGVTEVTVAAAHSSCELISTEPLADSTQYVCPVY